MAFVINIPSIVDSINGNELTLSVGGVRSYNLENLYNKKTLEKFKFFIGFQNKVCLNMCINTDGFKEDLRVSSASELQHKVIEVMQNYNAELHLMEMKEFTQDYLSEHQFAQLIGKSRLYQHLPKSEKQKIPMLNFNDSHINTMAKDYYEDKNFCRLADFLADRLALPIASGTSPALPEPKPTSPALLPTTTRAAKEKRRPPLTTFVTRLIATTRSSNSAA
jgi:hypothetical protein